MNSTTLTTLQRPLLPGWQSGIPAATPLRELPDMLDEFDVRYALVENEQGLIAGIVDLQHVCELLASDNPMERARWEDVPVGSIAELLVPCASSPEPLPIEDASRSFTTIRDDVGTAAVVIGGETFVNWNRVNAAFMQNHLDPVTQIPSRQSFNRRLREEVGRAARAQQPLAVMLIDLDHFKEVNDSHGHSTGDAVLKAVAESLRSAVRSYDFVARFGGDEFVVLCNGCGPDKIQIPVWRLRDSLTRRLQTFTPANVRVTLSIGVAISTAMDEHCCPELIVEQADICLYRAKRGGRATAFYVDLDPFGRPKHSPHEVVCE